MSDQPTEAATCGAYYILAQGAGTFCDREPGHPPMHEGEGYAPGSRVQWWP